MAEAIGAAANVAAIITIGLQTIKFIHETISGIKDAPAETKRTDQALLELSGILDQLEALTKAYTAHDSTQSNVTGTNVKEYFDKVEELVVKCTGDLKALEGKVRSLCHDAGDNILQRGVKRTRAFLENKELVKTRQIIDHNISTLTNQLTIAEVALSLDHLSLTSSLGPSLREESAIIAQRIETSSRNTDIHITQQITDLKNHLRHSSSETAAVLQSSDKTQKLNNEGVHLAISALQHKIGGYSNDASGQFENILALLTKLDTKVDALSDKDTSVSALKASSSSGSGSCDQGESKVMVFGSSSDTDDLRKCVQRLYDAASAGHKVWKSLSNEARIIWKDLEKILIALESSTRAPRGAKRDVYQEEDTRYLEDAEEMRAASRISRCITMTTQDYAPKPPRRPTNYFKRLKRSSSYQASHGKFNMSTYALAAIPSSIKVESDDGECIEIYSRRFSYLPVNMKLMMCATFSGQLSFNGVSHVLPPMLSFHAIIPGSSPVFAAVKQGDLERLHKLLQDGQASLTDCDEDGRPLLQHSLDYFQPRISEFLINKGADVDGLAPNRIGYLSVPLSQLSGKSDLSYPDCFHQCLYLLLEAGADPMINIDDENSTPLLIVIKRGSLATLKSYFRYSSCLINLEIKVEYDRTLLLSVAGGGLDLFRQPKRLLQICVLLLRYGANPHARTELTEENCLHLVMSFPGFAKTAGYVLMATLVAILRAKIDMYALDRDGNSPCHVARKGPRELESVWREALELAGLDPREVYAKSSVRWTEISSEKKSAKDASEEIIDILRQIDAEDISHNVYEEMLVKRVQAGADIYYRGSKLETPTAVARRREIDGMWKSVLRRCGYDPGDVYAKPELHPLLDPLPILSHSATSSARSRRRRALKIEEAKVEEATAAEELFLEDPWQREKQYPWNQYPWFTEKQDISQADHHDPWWPDHCIPGSPSSNTQGK